MALDRLGAAVVASAVAHVLLIYALVLPDGSRSGLREIVIRARLDVEQPSPGTPLAESVAPRVLLTPERGPPPSLAADEHSAETSAVAQPAVQSSLVTVEAALPGDATPASAVTEVIPPRSETEIAAIPDPVRYEARELDVYPRPMRPISPTYPASARDAHLAGSVTLLVLIDEGGRVVSAAVVDAEPGGIFEQAAREAVLDTAFYPAQRNDRTVGSQTLIKVEFDPLANL
ncbi:MAG: TonB family protein [Betaproteobacteria bacterium]